MISVSRYWFPRSCFQLEPNVHGGLYYLSDHMLTSFNTPELRYHANHQVCRIFLWHPDLLHCFSISHQFHPKSAILETKITLFRTKDPRIRVCERGCSRTYSRRRKTSNTELRINILSFSHSQLLPACAYYLSIKYIPKYFQHIFLKIQQNLKKHGRSKNWIKFACDLDQGTFLLYLFKNEVIQSLLKLAKKYHMLF